MQSLKSCYLGHKCQKNPIFVIVRLFSMENFSSPKNFRQQNVAIPPANPLTERQIRLEKIGKSLEIYLNKLQSFEKGMAKEEAAFELGKRHLANIMGWPINEEISQKNIDKAIEYLFPSGLHDKLALPVLKPPREILPQMRKVEFDKEYRPKGHLFYTINGKFYFLLSKVNYLTQATIRRFDNLRLSGNEISEDDLENRSSEIIFPGTSWITREDLMKKIDDHVTEDMYASFIMALDYLVTLPMAYHHKDFIMEFRTSVSRNFAAGGAKNIFGIKVPKLNFSEGNSTFAISKGKVKKTVVEVKVSNPGTGKCTYNGNHYSEFRSHLQREIIMAPLLLTDLFGKVDIEANFVYGNYGETVIPRAIRHGTSLCLAALFPEHREILRLAGLLTLDIRSKERSKINQPGARAKWIWKKR